MQICIIVTMEQVNIKPSAATLAMRARSAGLTQDQISIAVNASQSQVSRILSGKSKRSSRLLIEICKYVDSYSRGVSADLVRENDELIDALAKVWDGTAHQSAALAAVIESLGALCPAKRNVESRGD